MQRTEISFLRPTHQLEDFCFLRKSAGVMPVRFLKWRKKEAREEKPHFWLMAVSVYFDASG